MNVKYRIVLTFGLAIVLALGLIFAPRGYVVLVPAGCPQCLCVNAPTCAPIIAELKGVPFTSHVGKDPSPYIMSGYEQYLKDYWKKWGIIGDAAVAAIVSPLLFFGYPKLKRKFTNAHTRN